MAIISDFDFFSEKQVLSKSSYSKYCIDVGAPRDWSHRETPLYVNCLILGPHDKPLTIDVVIRNGAKGPEKIIATKSLEKAELVRGKGFSIAIPPTNMKYTQVALHYKVEGIAAADNPTTGQTCPVEPFLQEPVDLKNGITAYLSTCFINDIDYPRANTDKVLSS